MADDGICVVFVLIQKIVGRRESDLIDVFVYLFSRHADTPVGYGEGLLFLVDGYPHRKIPQFAFKFTRTGESPDLLGGINCVGYDFTQKDLVIAV